MPELQEVLRRAQADGVSYLGEVRPGLHVFALKQAMHRVRAYHAAVLQPHAARGVPQEMLLVGHVHVAQGRVMRVEGFNGQEGQRWTDRAKAELAKAGYLSGDAVVNPTTPLNDCRDTRLPLAGR